MMLSEFKRNIEDSWNIFVGIMIYSIQIDFAYFWNNWVGMISPIIYVFLQLMMIDAIYDKVDLIAGYTQSEMIFFLLISQINYALIWVWSYENISAMIRSVNTGELDLLLIKPVPSLLFVSLRQIKLTALLRDSMPNILILAYMVNWTEINDLFSLQSILMGIVVVIAGQIVLNTFDFLLAIPVFWVGESKSLLDMSWAFNNFDIPLEGLNNSFKFVFTTLIPTFIFTAVSTSVFLNKIPIGRWTMYSLWIMWIFLIFRARLWKRALKVYSSASS